MRPRRPRWYFAVVLSAGLAGSLASVGCEAGGAGEGPGHRAQRLALTPQQELEMGREASQEVLSHPEKYGAPLPANTRPVERVTDISRRIVRAAHIEPLQREVNFRLQGWAFEWQVHVLQNRQRNAFCLPAGKLFVFTGILPVAENDSQLATVLSHEISHALAHHSSERLAQEERYRRQFAMVGDAMSGMDSQQRGSFLSVLGLFQSKRHDREQEMEADHIGVFLMTFAGYEPEQAVRFWERMQRASGGQDPPEILSDHPSTAHRIEAMRDKWVPQAVAGKRAYDEGRIAPAPAERGQ